MRRFRSLLLAATSTSILGVMPACSSDGAPSVASSAADDLSSTVLVGVRRDARRCPSPWCGGYWLRQVNRGADERYVASIDLSRAGLDDAAAADALSSCEALLLRGALDAAEPSSFVATDVWRGLPDVSPRPLDLFYTVSDVATLVNARARFDVAAVDVTPAALGLVDVAWLTSRVTEHDAVIAGAWSGGDVLRGSQVYIHLPDRVGPYPAAPASACPEGLIPAYERSADRCLIRTACTPPAICPMLLPRCAAGYDLERWRGASGCARFVCDPAFVD